MTASEFSLRVEFPLGDKDPEYCVATINQHYQQSIEEFYAHTQRAWNAHPVHTSALIGTPAWRIGRSVE